MDIVSLGKVYSFLGHRKHNSSFISLTESTNQHLVQTEVIERHLQVSSTDSGNTIKINKGRADVACPISIIHKKLSEFRTERS